MRRRYPNTLGRLRKLRLYRRRTAKPPDAYGARGGRRGGVVRPGA